MDFNFLLSHFLTLLLVWMRLLGLFLLAPVFNSPLIPVLTRIGLSFLLAIVLLPSINPSAFTSLDGYYLLALISEILVGLVLGLLSGLVFSCIQIAGEVIDFQMGFSYANIVDPLSNISSSVMGQFYFLLTIIYYLGIGGYRLTLQGLVRSFSLIPVGGFKMSLDISTSFVDLMGEVMVVALELGAPIIATLFLSNLTLAIISRAVPQMNVFIVGLPLNIGLGLFMSLMILPYFLSYVDEIVNLFLRSFFQIFAP
ncbi:MAG: flagellar biosynthetic protein FliR [Candidatus Atribacteria bacterium]|nr:flagellar biosynthetic protein FliR [Candidatus Atribacteria bacterium]